MKFANSIIVGGPIAVGKSTLVGSLPFFSVQELDANDELQRLLLYRMYAGDKEAAKLFTFDMLIGRYRKYISLANRLQMTVFDRSIFEDIFFASNLLKDEPEVLTYYEAIGNHYVSEIIKAHGVPKLYVLLTCSGETFYARLFARDRKAETDNFASNEAYFKNMIETYELFMRKMFAKYHLPFVVVVTDYLSELEVNAHVASILKVQGLGHE